MPPADIVLRLARRNEARVVADIHMAARSAAAAYDGVSPFSAQETYDWFEADLDDPTARWRVAELAGRVVAYTKQRGELLEHIYVLPDFQGRKIGSALLDRAKAESPHRLRLFCFARNQPARRFYESRGFRAVEFRDASATVEQEPDVVYEWVGPPR